MLSATLLLVATACSSGLPDWNPLPPNDLGTRPARIDATSFTTRWPIKHVVFIIKENRTFDNLFGRFPGADGATTGMDQGTTRPLTQAPDRIPVDIVHCYQCALQAWNGGKMDGFASVSAPADRYAYTQFGPSDLPAYWHWAKRFVLGDNFFASAQGPSFPNHLYTIAAQSGGAHDNPIQDLERLAERHRTTGLFKAWGCEPVIINSDSIYAALKDGRADAQENPLTFADQFKLYEIVKYVAMTDHTQLWQSHIFPVDGLVQDVRDGRLPPVTWVTPRFELSEHPEYSFCWGQNWTTRVVNAIMASPMWRDTAIFITWDDYGGFYDHVPPPQVDRFGFGIRVPLLLISPYAKAGYVDHSLGEFSSVLRFIEDNWGLSQLTHRDRGAGNLSEAFDFSQAPRKPDPQPMRTDCPGPQFPNDPAPSVQG